MNKALALKIGIPALALVAVLVWAFGGLKPEALVAEAALGDAIDAVTGSVKVAAAKDIKIKTELPGRIQKVHAKIGDEIEEGDLLFSLESTETEIKLEQARIRLSALSQRRELGYTQERDIANVESEIDAIEQRIAFGAASEAELELKKRELEKLRIWLEREKIDRSEAGGLLQEQIKELENNLERMQIRAPFSGRMVELHQFEGAYVWAGTTLGRLISHERVVTMTLSAEDCARADKGQRVELRLAGSEQRVLYGAVSYVSPTADPNDKTRALTVEIDEGQGALVPGVAGEGILYKAERKNAVIVPRRALWGDRLFLVSGGRVEIRKVKPGYIGLNKAEILEGVEAGELIIVEGQGLLSEGDTVDVKRPADA